MYSMISQSEVHKKRMAAVSATGPPPLKPFDFRGIAIFVSE